MCTYSYYEKGTLRGLNNIVLSRLGKLLLCLSAATLAAQNDRTEPISAKQTDSSPTPPSEAEFSLVMKQTAANSYTVTYT
jgi:hypothetical protein